MNCCVTDLRCKDVINSCDGSVLGNVYDVEIDTCSGRLVAINVKERFGCFGGLFALLISSDCIRICWEDIEVIGNDTIIVKYNCPHSQNKNKKSFLDKFFR